MPPSPTSTPLMTDVTRKETPEVVPTSPLARSRESSAMRTVTSVGSAIARMLPTMTPNISNRMSTHRLTLVGSVNEVCGVIW
jgi:hypothetical protein